MIVANPRFIDDKTAGAQSPLRREVFEAYRPFHGLIPYRLDQLHSIDFSTSLCYFNNMSEKQKSLQLNYSELAQTTPEELDSAHTYLETVREAYRSGFQYRGNRSEEQREAAEYAGIEADALIDDYISALGLDDAVDIKLGDQTKGLTLNEMKDAWRHLWVGITVITNRIAAKKDPRFVLTELSLLPNKERMLIMQQLFNDFQEHNALRFGAASTGIKRMRPKKELGLDVFDDNGERVLESYDPDKLNTFEEIGARALKLGYESMRKRPDDDDPIVYMHTAGKMSTSTAKRLRVEHRADYPDAGQFYALLNSLGNAEETLKNNGR